MTETELMQKLYVAEKEGDCETIQNILQSHPHLFGENRLWMMGRGLRKALEIDSPEMVDVFVEFGADVNTPRFDNEPDGIIEESCLLGKCKKRAARRMLELGAKLNFESNGSLRCKTIDFAISKGDLEMVKLCVEYGAMFNSIYLGSTTLDHATMRGQTEIADYLRSIGGKTAKELGWVSPPRELESELSRAMHEYFEAEFVAPPMATIQGLLDSDPSIAIHVIDDGYQYILQTQGVAIKPIPVDPGDEDHRFIEIEMILPCDWPVGEELIKTDENAWPVTWLRRLAMHPHQSEIPMSKLFFYPNGTPPKPFAANTELSVWMLMQSPRGPLYVTDEKQIVIYRAVPLYKEEYDLVQKYGLGELGKRFDENKIQPHQMFVRKNVGIE